MHVIGAASSFPSLRVSVVDSLASNNNKDLCPTILILTFSNFRGFSSSSNIIKNKIFGSKFDTYYIVIHVHASMTVLNT